MIGYLSRRVALALPILLGVSLLVFALLQLAPGSPVDSLVGPYATTEDKAELSAALGLDRPLPLQYLSWLGDVLRGDLGQSISKQTPVAGLLLPALLNTLLLAAFAAAVAILLGAGVGVLWARTRHPWVRHLAEGIATTASAMPQYVLGLGLVALAAQVLTWFPVSGKSSPSGAGAGGAGDVLRHLILPGFTASLVMLGIVARMVRVSLADVLAQPWVQTMTARGLRPRRVLRHTVRNALPPVLTIVGLQFGYLVGGVLFVEIIFSWPGLGTRLYEAISARDYPVIEGGVLLGAAGFVLINILVDLASAAIDPRLRSAT
ncbi:ABC transporter permease [Dactylosporangium sp. CA-092794]|uniref:ABC transporter permease n=1 Tax=Dactylosporangium sp. CA-092794 TaxID=3239929 RepID=UPI003D8B320B